MNQLRTACRYFVWLSATVVLIAGCATVPSTTEPAEPSVTAGPATASPSTAASPGRTLGTPQMIASADSPTTLAQAPDGRLYFSELAGRVRVLDRSGEIRTVAQFNVSDSGERGLLGLALHPRFPDEPYGYAFFSPASDESISRVVRFDIREGSEARERESRTILELPAGNGCCHKGGRVAFGPDGKLYVSVGDNQVPRAAQDRGDLRGKILRYNDDGTIPDDGPFGRNPVWATGLRNPFGLGFGHDGTLWATDNGPSGNDGPSCCDELNRIERGGDYSWPDAYGKRDSTPVWTSGDDVAVPTGVSVIGAGTAFCTYAWERMIIVENGVARDGPDGCMLDVIQGRDAVYFSSSTAIFKA